MSDLTADLLRQMLITALDSAGGFGYHYATFVQLGYLLRHRQDNTLRYFYASKNSSLNARALILSDKQSIERQLDYFRRNEQSLLDQLTNKADSSGWVFDRFTNCRIVLYRMR